MGERPDLITIVRTVEPLTLLLPFHLVSMLKQKVFKNQVSEQDLRLEVGFLGYEYLNPILHSLGLGSISLAHYSVERLKISTERVRIAKGTEVDKARIEATDFYLLPLREPTERMRF